MQTTFLVVVDDTTSTLPRVLSAPRKTHARSYAGYSDGLLAQIEEAQRMVGSLRTWPI
jgi:hypothetical protein